MNTPAPEPLGGMREGVCSALALRGPCGSRSPCRQNDKAAGNRKYLRRSIAAFGFLLAPSDFLLASAPCSI